MTGVIQGFRAALFDTAFPAEALALSMGVTVVVLAGGLMYFKRMEDSFADVI